ncbi:MAG: CAP domain-containing protein [Verrucomicrobiota bacterium]|nr:CAP domain-containing protein [Verrucomicrobiota bacterium]
MIRPFVALLLASICSSVASAAPSDNSGSAVVREMNLARQNPALYATYLEELRGNFQGNLLVLPGRIPLRTKEGTRGVDEAIRFLRSAAPQAPLANSPGMSHAAADHCTEQAGGGMSHSGRDGSNTGQRINRYGSWSGIWGENLSCGRSGAREIVMALIIDDGLGGRKHRQNIFNPAYNFAGAAIGRHATYGTICSTEFAGGYVENGQSPNETLVARN